MHKNNDPETLARLQLIEERENAFIHDIYKSWYERGDFNKGYEGFFAQLFLGKDV